MLYVSGVSQIYPMNGDSYLFNMTVF